MKLYVCEKASVGKALANVLPGVKMRDENFVRCGEDIVAWASGHLLELYEPEDYDARYKRWSADTLLYVPEIWKLKEKPRTKALFSGLKKLIRGLKSSDVIVNVGDADREGTLLIDEIIDYCGWKGETKRLRINDVNPDAMRRALGGVKDDSDYRGEYLAGQARMYADWLVGLALTRYVTISLGDAGYDVKTVSVGRVQTPTLGLVATRDREIKDFKPSLYYEIYATLALDDGRKIRGKWQARDTKLAALGDMQRIEDRHLANEITDRLKGVSGVISSVERKTHKVSPPLPYSLSKLQMAASRKYDITDTLKHLQKLYEFGYVTYPRTGCEYIPEGHFVDAERVIDSIRAGCPSLSDMLAGVALTRKTHAWNTSKISEHHAIIPTTRVPLEGTLSEAERKIYDLVCSRYVLQFLADYEYEDLIIEFEADREVYAVNDDENYREFFRASGRTVINLGWQGWDKQDTTDKGRSVDKNREDAGDEPDNEDEDSRDGQGLPVVREGETGTLVPNLEEKTTKPPKPLTYHSLLAAMNNIHQYVKDSSIRSTLKEIQGIGTEATQEGVIATLFDRGYIRKEKKIIVSTELGRTLIEILRKSKGLVLVEPDMTALWEMTMSEIEAGKESLGAFISGVVDMVRDIISDPLSIPDIQNMPRKKSCLSEDCNGFLTHITHDVKRPFFSCPKCHKTFNDVAGEPVSRKEYSEPVIEAPCPLNCGRQARRYKSEYGYYWRCSCSSDAAFKDIDGQPAAPVERAKAVCPVSGCKGHAVRFQRHNDGKPFWKCDKCGNFFEDLEGVPIKRESRKGKSAKYNDSSKARRG